jgi:hypothetical protein
MIYFRSVTVFVVTPSTYGPSTLIAFMQVAIILLFSESALHTHKPPP